MNNVDTTFVVDNREVKECFLGQNYRDKIATSFIYYEDNCSRGGVRFD
jgi:hypothetical protein